MNTGGKACVKAEAYRCDVLNNGTERPKENRFGQVSIWVKKAQKKSFCMIFVSHGVSSCQIIQI